MLYHPDKHRDPELKRQAEQLFNQVHQAYEGRLVVDSRDKLIASCILIVFFYQYMVIKCTLELIMFAELQHKTPTCTQPEL